MRIAIVAALPGELKQLVKRGWKRVPAQRKTVSKWVARIGDADCVAVCGGMGAEAARQAFAEAEADGAVDMVLSVGWAGALSDGLRAGETYVASAVVDAQTGERFELAQGASRSMVLVSTARVAQEAEKRRLAATYQGAMVDMESATVARLAQMRGIPLVCMKAISDDVGERLPDFNAFIDARGQMRMAAFIQHILVRPGYWGALVRLGRASAEGAETLAVAINGLLSGPLDALADFTSVGRRLQLPGASKSVKSWITKLVILIPFIIAGVTELGDFYGRRLPIFVQATQMLQESDQARDTLGEPVKIGWPIGVSSEESHNSGHVQLAIPVAGSRSRGVLHAIGTKSGGRWTLGEVRLTMKDAGSSQIFLSRP